MTLSRRSEREIIPQYSLTGDLLSFLRCGLQYRYHNGSSLPPSRPVQLWFGEFIHGVMESAFRIWSGSPQPPSFPWPCNPTPPHQTPAAGRLAHDIGILGDTVEAALFAQGKNPRSHDARESAYLRASRAVNELGPHLFPLISVAEEKVIGTRSIPSLGHRGTRATLYELHGIIDVLTNVQISAASTGNAIRRGIQLACPGYSGQFEVIVDYKGSRRPEASESETSYWQQHDWQVQTYSWLRTRQPNSLPVAAGVLLYINELAPGRDDLIELKNSRQRGTADVVPPEGTQDAYLLNTWRPGDTLPEFSESFRLDRAIRVIPVTSTSQEDAANHFDRVVSEIEMCVSNEADQGSIVANWQPCGDGESCAACDFRYFCPDPFPHSGTHPIESPRAP